MQLARRITRRPSRTPRATALASWPLVPLLLLLAGQPIRAQEAAAPAIIPRPVKMTPSAGTFAIDAATLVIAGKEANAEAETLIQYVEPALGRRLKLVESDQARDGAIALMLGESREPLGDEGYRLEVSPRRAIVRAAKPAGLFYGVQTLRQLLPPAAYGSQTAGSTTWSIPCVQIVDYPRFAWRGLLQDTARHFMPKEYLKKLIEVMAAHKLNTLQLHLTDDQGWRIEIKKYPKLTEVGAWRNETLVGHMNQKPWRFDGKRHGGFYSQDDIRELVSFAARRHVNLVPEIEMPGHGGAAITAYPELSCFPDRPKGVWTRWGISPDIFNPNPHTVGFLQDVLTEVMAMFPSRFIHVGGDEAIKDYWKESPEVQRRIRELGLKDEEELQSWFIRQMDGFLTRHGRRLIGWDEILQGGLAPGATVMSWRGQEGGIAAARSGHDVVMTPTSHTYFDYYQGPTASEPLAIGGMLLLDKVYSFDPVPPTLTPAEARRILGAQGQVWTEYMPTPRQAEYMTWPRAVALAEVLWTPQASKDYADFHSRLRLHRQRLDALQVGYRPLEP
jgi:hexosaminidase